MSGSMYPCAGGGGGLLGGRTGIAGASEMFEEGAWAPEAGPSSPLLPRGPPPVSAAAAWLPEAPAFHPRPAWPRPAGGVRGERRRLLATLRRLEEEWGHPAAAAVGDQDRKGAPEPMAAEEPSGSRRERRKRARHPREEPPVPQEPPGLPEPKQAPAETSGRGPGEVESKQGTLKATETVLTRRQWKNRQKNKRRQRNKFKAGGELGLDARGIGGDQSLVGPPTEESAGNQEEGNPLASVATELTSCRAASLRLRLEERLDSARFRYINQQLYTCSSQEAAQLFQDDPEALAVYHRGFSQQVARWPEKPLQRFVQYLRNRPASLVVADFGCGDCTLAHNIRNKVHCFDLVALDPRVTVCDMAQVPLEAESVDVAVFCLALMGTNLREILEEANRVLRIGGTLLVAEVASRFPDVRAFLRALAQLGFRLLSKDVSGSHFFAFEFRKAAPAPAGRGSAAGKPLRGLALRPCLYKRR